MLMNIQFMDFAGYMPEITIYDIEIFVDGEVQKGRIDTIKAIAEQEFNRVASKLSKDARPCRVKYSRVDKVWSQIGQNWKELVNYMEYENDAYHAKYNIETAD
jgi:hypothetical protein